MPRPSKKKVLSFIGMIFGGILLGLFLSFYLMLRFSLPKTDGELKLPGIKNNVEITFDKMGIPQIWAESETDAYFSLGYQHAADRMFQMDLARRVAKGTLSEMLGGISTSIDKEQIKIGHRRLAKKGLDILSDENRLRFQAYADGVNAYYHSCNAIPFEYRFLPVGFEPWTVLDCLTLLSFQTWFSNALMNQDHVYNELVKKIDFEKAKTLLFPYPDWAPTTIPDKKSISKKFERIEKSFRLVSFELEKEHTSSALQVSIAEKYFSEGRLPFLLTESSNAWVIAPSRTESGHAILASDPHLELSRLPQFWYAVGLHIKNKNINAFGITTPGLPFFIMGHNGQTAYAFTAGGTDLIDYTILDINPDNRNQYATPEGWKDFAILEEPFIDSETDSISSLFIKQSDFGIVVDEESTDDNPTAMYWAGFDVDLNLSVTNAFQLISISSFEQFRSTVTQFGALDANYLYADKTGNIGYQLSSPLLKRSNTDANFPQDISNATSLREYHVIDETPNIFNPENGWIASCNNLPERDSYVRGHYFANRILSITDLLESKEKFSVDDMYKFQFDLKDRYLKSFFPLYTNSAFALEDEAKKEMYYKLLRWDGTADVSSEEAAFVVVFFDQLKRITFEDELGSLYNKIPSKWIEHIPMLDSVGWFDDVNTGDTTETLKIAAQKAWVKTFKLTNGKSWGEMQTIQMQHPMAIIPILGSLLSLSSPEESIGGTSGTLNASFFRKKSDTTYSSLAGPSMRFVIDFSHPDNATIVLPAGNSGNPMSKHFFDFYELWKKNERWNVPLSYEKVKEKAVSSLILVPSETE